MLCVLSFFFLVEAHAFGSHHMVSRVSIPDVSQTHVQDESRVFEALATEPKSPVPDRLPGTGPQSFLSVGLWGPELRNRHDSRE